LQPVVTYRHGGVWEGPVTVKKDKILSRTVKKLVENKKLTILYLGDSITTGMNCSGFSKCEPYTPSWPDMTSALIAKHYNADVKAVNIAVGGTSSEWGVKRAKTLGLRESPDLAVIAFGMNDGCGVPGEKYISNLQKIMKIINSKIPECEFILVTTMLPNPILPEFNKHQQSYEAPVLELEREGAAVVNMTAVHRYLLTKKDYKDMTGNNVNHPNDYLSRAYAINVSQTLI
jgi:lysophospholipase L1-like esterase